MEVDRVDFYPMLPTMLKHISNAHFVAFDLELSGIPVRKQHASEGRQNLQQRYTEVKRAAETFHILQIGLTCVEQDAKNGKYLIRSFNFNLSPIIGDGLGVEREFTYSTGAVEFLLSVGYSMDAPFKEGVPYLSREETEIVRKKAMEKWDRASIPDIKIRPDDHQALNFMKRVKTEIDEWLKLSRADARQYTIGGRMTDNNHRLPLNRFEKRLAHQIVRSDYPELHTYSTLDYVKVETGSKKEQTEEREQLIRRLDRSMSTNIGFRWLTEALAGQDVSAIDFHSVPLDIKGEKNEYTSVEQFMSRVAEIRQALESSPRVLVGHNCFMDLAFIYRYFYGNLPDTVEEFQEALHRIFPMIVDTKFLSTSGPDAHHFRNSQLSQIEETLSTDAAPVFDYPRDHPRYLNAEKYHEAGFDSFITSKVFLRLTSRLNTPTQPLPKMPKPPAQEEKKEAAQPIIADEEGFIEALSEKKRKAKKAAEKAIAASVSQSKFSHSNPYDALSRASPTPPTSRPESAATPNTTADSATVVDGTDDNGLIPQWNSDFWKTYGNKLRVYGTQEEQCDLTAKRMMAAVASADATKAVKEGEREDGNATAISEAAEASPRRGSVLSTLQESSQSLWLGKK